MRDLIQNNFALKILSLILATLLWFAIESSVHRKERITHTPLSDEATLDLPCPVAALMPAAMERLLSITPSEVQVKLAGSPSVLGELELTNLAVFVRVPLDLKSEDSLDVEVKLPPTVRLLDVNPPRVSVKPKPTTN
jgi:YbbR domain-containing protein